MHNQHFGFDFSFGSDWGHLSSLQVTQHHGPCSVQNASTLIWKNTVKLSVTTYCNPASLIFTHKVGFFQETSRGNNMWTCFVNYKVLNRGRILLCDSVIWEIILYVVRVIITGQIMEGISCYIKWGQNPTVKVCKNKQLWSPINKIKLYLLGSLKCELKQSKGKNYSSRHK